jgi:hypothetical protein
MNHLMVPVMFLVAVGVPVSYVDDFVVDIGSRHESKSTYGCVEHRLGVFAVFGKFIGCNEKRPFSLLLFLNVPSFNISIMG